MKWKMLLVALCAVVVVSANRIGYREGAQAAKQEQTLAELNQFKKLVLEFDKAAQQMTAAAEKLESQNLEWSKSYDEIIKQNPLPVDCRAGDLRLRSYNDAIDEAAATRKLGSPMP